MLNRIATISAEIRWPCLGLEHKVIDIFVADVSVDDVAKRDGLRCGEVAVGFDFIDDWQVFDIERAVVGNTAGGANLSDMFAQSTVGGDTNFDFRVVTVALDFQHFHASVVKEDALERRRDCCR